MFAYTLHKIHKSIYNKVIIVPLVTIFVHHLDILLSITPEIDKKFDRITQTIQNQDIKFDYIIVGAGSAGSVLASRLSQNASIKVLLLETGGVPSPVLSIPVISYLLNNQKSHDWAYRTVSQKNSCLGLDNNVSYWPAGKTLGGSSAINGLIYIRGNVQGYDLIAKRTGDYFWKFSNILKHYKKVENYNGWFNRESHGKSGHLSVTAPTLVPVTKYLLFAGRELGYGIRDPNTDSRHTEGFAPVEFYLKNGHRSSAYINPLKPSMLRPNLIVRKYSFVTRVLYKHKFPNKEVAGVMYKRHGKMYKVFASREVILSAGVLSTPKILMLSGIGPKHHLKKLNISLRVDLPVGQRLQDKYGAVIGPFIVPRGYSYDMFRDSSVSESIKWLRSGKGTYGSGRTEATYAILSDTAKSLNDTFAPDIHTYVISLTPQLPKDTFGYSFNFNSHSLKYLNKSLNFGDAFFQLVTLSRSVGRGWLKLRNKNPHAPVVINPKYLQNSHDVKTLVDGLKFAVNLVENTQAMRRINAKLFNHPLPGCENITFKSDAYFECFARHLTITAYKYCGTATIGTEDDPEAVIDSKFRVFGVQNLRVIDGSVLRIDEVNTNDVTMRMIGELGATAIQETWK